MVGLLALGLKDEWTPRENGLQKRSIEELELYEVSVLDKTPAYIATSIESRGEVEVLTETRIEEFQAKVDDISTKPEDKPDNPEETKKQEETRDNPEPHYFSNLQNEITLLQLKGGNLDKCLS